MAEEMSFAEAEGLEREERKGRKVKWLIQLLLPFWIRKIFSSHQVSKSISWRLDLFAAVLFCFVFPQQKQLSKRHWKMWVLVKGMYLTFCLQASCWLCYQSTQAPSIRDAPVPRVSFTHTKHHCAEQAESTGDKAARTSSQAELGRAGSRSADVQNASHGCLI